MDQHFQCRSVLSAVHLLRSDEDVSPVQIDLLKHLALSYDKRIMECEDLTSIKMRIEELSKNIFESLFKKMPIELCHAVATSSAAMINEPSSPRETNEFVYGEIEFDSFAEILQVALRRMESRHKFVDLGHGIGKAIIAAVLLTDFQEFHGIEILKGLHDISLSVEESFNDNVRPLLSKASPKIVLEHGSFIAPDIIDSVSRDSERYEEESLVHFANWMDADLVLANSTCFPLSFMQQVEEMCRMLKPGARVITFTSSLKSEFFKIIFKKQMFMSWGRATVYIHERIDPSDVVIGQIDKMELMSPSKRRKPFKYQEIKSPISSGHDPEAKMSTSTANEVPRPTLLGKSNHTKEGRQDSGSWNPDTPTLKKWALHNLHTSEAQLKQMREHTRWDGAGNDAEASPSTDMSSSDNRAHPPTAWRRSSTSISSSDNDIDDTDLDFERMNIHRFAYSPDEQGVYVTDSGSDSSIDDSDSEGDLDDDQISENLEKFYHVKEDDEDDDDNEDDDIDEMFDDSS